MIYIWNSGQKPWTPPTTSETDFPPKVREENEYQKRPGQKKQDVSHIKVFGSTVSVLIPKGKRHKSDIHKNWKGIFVGYSDTTKHVRAWAPKTQQILLVSNPYIDESEQGAKLLVDNPLDLIHRIAKRKVPTGELGPRDQPRKIQATEAAETSLIKNTSLSPADTGDAATEIPSTHRRY